MARKTKPASKKRASTADVTPHEWLVIDDVARELTVSRGTAYKMVKTGVLPSVKVSPRSIRVLRTDLDAYLSKRAAATAT